ncbi:phage tail assembly chaperone [Aliiroseovarius zhejiangensis]|uniref:Phage tail assembly chaperone n=1 Tax=Aliiroseovarius zhejiangensis TaxID=1632025 RepID=A0ABQ3ILZ9_9RHOB|nr:rcc01693 family protein [Aliiroseovarius zhejiangensis]GHE86389.1 phage tail assembly chaperone [Aliiroseovarius zhejiangensis]
MSTCPAFDWPGLMRLGLGRLGLRPDQFWALTPVELMVMAGLDDQPAPCLRARLEELALAFPDAPKHLTEGE